MFKLAIAFSLLLAGCATALPPLPPGADLGEPARTPDIYYEPSPPRVVTAMLKLANVGPNDVVYDLGSGDGRIPIAAAREFGARGVGVELQPKLVAVARANADKAGVTARTEFRIGDLFTANIADATVVTLFLSPDINRRLRETMRALRPGTRVISHYHGMGDWEPDRKLTVSGRPLYLWVVKPASPPK